MAALALVVLGAAAGSRGLDGVGRFQMVQDADAQPSGRPRPPTEATTAYREAMTQLQRDINIRYSGNPDRDFAALLAAQRQALEQLAAVELAHGGDPAMRALAEQVRQQAQRDAAAVLRWEDAQKDK